MSSSPVCFGAKNSDFGSFHANFYGKLAAVRLVHLYGYVTCDTRHKTYWSYWGCGSYGAGLGKINVVITTQANTVILPPEELIVTHSSKWSQVPGYDSVSPELVLSFFQPRQFQYGEELRLWYGEDLTNSGEGDNGGTACVGVYAFVLWVFSLTASGRFPTWHRFISEHLAKYLMNYYNAKC